MSRSSSSDVSAIDARMMASIAPRVRHVIEQLTRAIQEGQLQLGDQLPTVRQIAEQYNLSIRGVSKAIEHLEGIGLIERIQGSGCYIRSKSLPDMQTNTTTHAYLFTMMDQPVAMEQLIRPLTNATQAAGLFVSLLNTDSEDGKLSYLKDLRETWRHSPPRAVLVKDARPTILQQIERVCLPDTRRITLHQGRSIANRNWHKIEPDEYCGYEMAAEWLIQAGCNQLALVVPEIRMSPSRIFDKGDWFAPQDAIREVTAAAGKPSPLFHLTGSAPTDRYAVGLGIDNLRALADLLQSKQAPDGIIAATIRMQSVLLAADMAGRTIGRDLQVIGVGDRSAAMRDGYPCVSLGHEHVAAHATALILSEDSKPGGDIQHITIRPELITLPST